MQARGNSDCKNNSNSESNFKNNCNRKSNCKNNCNRNGNFKNNCNSNCTSFPALKSCLDPAWDAASVA